MTAPVEVGEVVAGKYEIQQVLAAGSMGVVVKAKHLHLGRSVALKFMLTQNMGGRLQPEAVERFKRESQAAARLRGENIAQVLDVGALDDGTPYIVMEFLEGGDLRAHLDRSGVLPIKEAVGLVLQACLAMAEAHSCGILHRDLKPENLFLTKRPDGRPLIKVLDFGISKLFESDEPEQKGAIQTQITQVMGSPYYMSPEQVRSTRDVDVRADIWSLGVILFELVSGKMPYEHRSSTMELLARIISDEPRPLHTVAPFLSRALCAVTDRCLKKEPDERYQNIAELALALEPFAEPQDRPAIASVCATLGVAKGDAGGPGVVNQSLLSRLASGASDESMKLSTLKLKELNDSSLITLDGESVARSAPTLQKGVAARGPTGSNRAAIKRLGTAPTAELQALGDPDDPIEEPGATVRAVSTQDGPSSSSSLEAFALAPTDPANESRPGSSSGTRASSTSPAGAAEPDEIIGSKVGTFAEDPHQPDRKSLPPPASSTRKTMADDTEGPSMLGRRIGYIVATSIFAALTAMLVFDLGGARALEPVNHMLYRIGHTATRSANTTTHLLAGTIVQLALPLILIFVTSWFFYRFLTMLSVWWLGQGLFFTAPYIADAPYQRLEPIAGDMNGYAYVFERWQLMDVASDVANALHWAGVGIMAAALLAMLVRCWRPYDRFV